MGGLGIWRVTNNSWCYSLSSFPLTAARAPHIASHLLPFPMAASWSCLLADVTGWGWLALGQDLCGATSQSLHPGWPHQLPEERDGLLEVGVAPREAACLHSWAANLRVFVVSYSIFQDSKGTLAFWVRHSSQDEWVWLWAMALAWMPSAWV